MGRARYTKFMTLPATIFIFQLKNVAVLNPALRQTSATEEPSSACLMMNAFCASVNFEAFTRFRSSPSQGSSAETLTNNGSVFGEHISWRTGQLQIADFSREHVS